ncbi:MAG: hypothetical protein ER33_01895 [Cyanobium sp. CACIAM 14]|nr:MAG: hypothetical protein ER33_01895 [Cyanobium sp. CACIAM 14]
MSSETPKSRSWSLIDLGAAAAALLAIGGVIWSPRLSGAVARATGSLEPVTVMVDVRGAPAADPAGLMQQARKEGQVAIVIRNQPHGNVAVKRIIPLDRIISTLNPEGKVVSAPDPNQKTFSTFDGRFVLEGQGLRTGGGVVFGNQTIKIGAPVELEGTNYRFNGTVTDLKLGTS